MSEKTYTVKDSLLEAQQLGEDREHNVNHHWDYGYSADRDEFWYSYWCCDPQWDCGSNTYESFKTLDQLIEWAGEHLNEIVNSVQ
jgi:hypothetical protein